MKKDKPKSSDLMFEVMASKIDQMFTTNLAKTTHERRIIFIEENQNCKENPYRYIRHIETLKKKWGGGCVFEVDLDNLTVKIIPSEITDTFVKRK